MYNVSTENTTPYDDQKPGTSGLRKKTAKFMNSPNYTENFIQSILDSIPQDNNTDLDNIILCIGGDGRYYNLEIMDLIFKICAGNKVKKLIFGLNGIMSTPTTSHLIRTLEHGKVTGGIILTASHNPGGPENDIGIKYNLHNGAPAPESVTNEMFKKSSEIKQYKIVHDLPSLDLTKCHSETYTIVEKENKYDIEIQVLDSTIYYTKLMKDIFDFPMIKSFLQKQSSSCTDGNNTFCFDALNGVTGPYAIDIFHKELGIPLENLQNCVPKPDFGGLHPDPNLTYAHTLVEKVNSGKFLMGAASDGDGDRNMIYGWDSKNDKPTFISPGDSVAIIAEYSQFLPYFQKGKNAITGLARSFPTSSAIDRVAKSKNLQCYEVPTGWKFFCDLFDSDRLCICGEESFGTGSNHIREKDGLWAVIAWLNILSVYDNEKTKSSSSSSSEKETSLFQVQHDFWLKYGRDFFTRYDFENLETEKASKIIDNLESFTKASNDVASRESPFDVEERGNFEYKDIFGTVYQNQGLFVRFKNGLRIVVRLSGTGSEGSTIRLYVEKYSNDSKTYTKDAEDYLGQDIAKILHFLKFKEFIGTDVPTVKT